MEFRNGQVPVRLVQAAGSVATFRRSPGGARPVSVRSGPRGARASNWCQVVDVDVTVPSSVEAAVSSVYETASDWSTWFVAPGSSKTMWRPRTCHRTF